MDSYIKEKFGFQYSIINNGVYNYIEINNYKALWLNCVNIISHNKKLSVKDLEELLLSYLEKEYTNEIILQNEIQVHNIILNNKIEKLREHLIKCIPESQYISNLFLVKSNNLLEKEYIAKIIINEFIDIYKNNNNVSLSIKNNNVFHWNVKFFNFTNKELIDTLDKLNKKYNYNYIEVDIFFDSQLYPYSPPVIKFLRPRLYPRILYKLSNLKLVNIKYWTPSRTMGYIINTLHAIFDKNIHSYSLDIDSKLNDIADINSGAYYHLEHCLIKLASITHPDLEHNLDIEEYKKADDIKKEENNRFIKGTGYGHDGLSTWNIETYTKSQEEKNITIGTILLQILTEINTGKYTMSILEDSYLFDYMRSMFNGTTYLDIVNRGSIYKILFEIINKLLDNYTLTITRHFKDCFIHLYTIIQIPIKMSPMGVDIYMTYITNIFNKLKITNISSNNNTNLSSNIKYINYVESIKFETANVVNSNYYYEKNYLADKGTKVSYHKRLVQEFSMLKTSLPVSYDASILIRIDEDFLSVNRALITGPKDTPYHNGCFIIDTYIPINYPNVPPLTWFVNHGNKRFNPNLYDNGKICLSLLGTWSANSSESWIPKTSNLYQVYMSIQSQILVDKPYFNEPGFEKSIGTEIGESASKKYNYEIRYYTMCHAIYDLLKNPKLYPEYEKFINFHFYNKKKDIIETCQKWLEELPENHELKEKYVIKLNQIKELLEKIDM
jgi:ubiquitin-protein ligase